MLEKEEQRRQIETEKNQIGKMVQVRRGRSAKDDNMTYISVTIIPITTLLSTNNNTTSCLKNTPLC